jgi:hypothetical protein
MSGLPALVFFLALIAFVVFESVQVVRGRVHLGGIARAALELLIVSPVLVVIILGTNKIFERLGLGDPEATLLRRWVAVSALFVVWAPWMHYRATRPRKERTGSDFNRSDAEGK